MAIEKALGRFVDLIEDPASDDRRSRETYVDLGRGEMRAGRSLDALLSAYRLGSRLAWRRFVEAGVAGGLDPGAIYALGEGIFAYIDELSAESAEGYAEEQSAAAGERQRLRRRLIAPARPGPARVRGVRPRRGRRRVVAAAAQRRRARHRATRTSPATPRPTRSPPGSPAASATRPSGRASSGWRSCSCPTPARPRAARRLTAAAQRPPGGARARRCRSRAAGHLGPARHRRRTPCSPRAGSATATSRSPRSTCRRS